MIIMLFEYKQYVGNVASGCLGPQVCYLYIQLEFRWTRRIARAVSL